MMGKIYSSRSHTQTFQLSTLLCSRETPVAVGVLYNYKEKPYYGWSGVTHSDKEEPSSSLTQVASARGDSF